MDLMLPGRESDMEDFEAQGALRTLLEAEKLKNCGDAELLDRVAEQIEHNVAMLQRVADLVEELRSTDAPKTKLDKFLGKESRYG